MNPIQNEPVLTFVGGGVAIVNASIAVWTESGHMMTPGLILAINSLATALLTFLARSFVSPVKAAEE